MCKEHPQMIKKKMKYFIGNTGKGHGQAVQKEIASGKRKDAWPPMFSRDLSSANASHCSVPCARFQRLTRPRLATVWADRC